MLINITKCQGRMCPTWSFPPAKTNKALRSASITQQHSNIPVRGWCQSGCLSHQTCPPLFPGAALMLLPSLRFPSLFMACDFMLQGKCDWDACWVHVKVRDIATGCYVCVCVDTLRSFRLCLSEILHCYCVFSKKKSHCPLPSSGSCSHGY